MEPERKIVHVDMDAFYASIEQRDHPEYKNKPIIVGGDPNRRGVVATCSYEARTFGIHSAMPSRTALRLCPEAIFVSPRFAVYRDVSAQIMTIFREYSDIVEPLSLDEAYLDVSHDLKEIGSATLVARAMKQQIYQETGLTASAGVSCNKFVAKLASDMQKPNGLTVVPPQQVISFLEAMPIQKFFGVGKVTEARLRAKGIATGADLKLLGEEQLHSLLGERGKMLYHFVRGDDDRPVMPFRERKSVGKEITLVTDINDREEMEHILEQLCGQVEKRLKELYLTGYTIILKVKFADFQHLTRSVTLSYEIQDARIMMPHIISLLAQLKNERRQVRLLGVTISSLQKQNEKRKHPQVYFSPSLWELNKSE